ncbi:MAG: RluA family pseudouridine synthase [Alphaproteobacteria bacterium]|nr:RluA family pseudouridine synthase [Alphaproteobacteria bacterium]|tara:strand:- start:230 stop:967 length:738 start_codon:yes stop_codon:yes gene_type:complete
MCFKNIRIFYEDKDLIVIDKPSGLTVHPGAGQKTSTLVDFLVNKYGKKLSNLSGIDRPGIVHRLDKDTSGLLLIARNNKTHKLLQDMFKKREINRLYYAIVWGLLQKNSGSFTMNIGRNPKNRKKFSIFQNGGKNAVTKYKVKKNFSNVASLIECKLLTGRTHQIRVHLSSSGNSIIGDKKYGKNKSKLIKNVDKSIANYIISFKRQALHAYFLSFIHPIKKEEIRIISKLPSDFNNLVNKLKSI